MNMTSIGDLAQSLMLRHRSVELRQTISTLSNELSTGQVTDVAARVGNDFSYLSDIDRNLARLEGFSVAASEARLFADASQIRLDKLHGMATSLSSAILASSSSALGITPQNLSTQAKGSLEAAISTLNGTVAGRSLFAGTATDKVPLESAETLLTELQSVVSGLATADAVETAVRDWFADPAGFEAVMYNGADETLSPIEISPGQKVNLTLKADDEAFRDVISSFALAALAGDPAAGLAPGLEKELFSKVASSLQRNQDALTSVSADLGFAEARIEEAATRNASARTGLEYARNSLLEADPFETATRLEEAQFQLESLFTVTVRSSQLSLLNFMR